MKSRTSDPPYSFQSGDITLTSNRSFATPDEASASGGFMGAAINVGEVYASLVRDLDAGTYKTPGFEHALHNARLVEAVKRAAEQDERQRILKEIEGFDDARVTQLSKGGMATSTGTYSERRTVS